ncbi:MAG: HEAT repeat domain-containing protein [Planctomycetota bacterium]
MTSSSGAVMSTNLEVYFCDVCNESVPASDLEARRAVRLKGKVIGACCLQALRPGPAAVAVDRRAGGGTIALLAVVTLAGIGAATAFLDWRVSDEVGGLSSRVNGLEDRARHGQERFSAVEEAVTQLGARLDLDKVSAQVAGLESRVDQVRASVDLRTTRLDETLQAAAERQSSVQTEQQGALDRLRESVERLGGDVAALRAMPRPAPAAAIPDVSAPPVVAPAAAEPELPAELQHHVMALGDADPGTRFSSVDKLLRSNEPRVLSALLPMAKDDNVFVRRLTVEGLRGFRRPESVDVLLVALSDPEPLVRVTAHASLRALTGQTFEFDDASASTRATSLRRWQDWWERNRATFG